MMRERRSKVLSPPWLTEGGFPPAAPWMTPAGRFMSAGGDRHDIRHGDHRHSAAPAERPARHRPRRNRADRDAVRHPAHQRHGARLFQSGVAGHLRAGRHARPDPGPAEREPLRRPVRPRHRRAVHPAWRAVPGGDASGVRGLHPRGGPAHGRPDQGGRHRAAGRAVPARPQSSGVVATTLPGPSAHGHPTPPVCP